MSDGEWKELRPDLGPPIDGLIETTPVLDNGATRLARLGSHDYVDDYRTSSRQLHRGV
jgi:hypothetical protein